MPIVGTSGSTPLHFAAANGNTDAVTLLLRRGAHPNRADKHGVTPEILARQNGWLECADVLKQWLINKDRDLRERPGGERTEGRFLSPDSSTTHERSGPPTGDSESSVSFTGRRRIHVKQSIDTALGLLKPCPTDSKPTWAQNGVTSTPPASPAKFLADGEHTFHPPEIPPPVDGSQRRPSLPHIFHSSSSGASGHSKMSTSQMSTSPGSVEPDLQEQDHSQTGTGRIGKLGSKYSLRNLFKKAQAPEFGHAPDASQSSVFMTSPASASSLILSSSPNLPSPFSDTSFEGSAAVPLTPQNGSRSNNPLAVDLHNTVVKEHHRSRNRSRSASSGKFTPDEVLKPTLTTGSPLARPGILRGQDYRRERSGSGTSARVGSSPHRGGVVFDEDLSIVPGHVIKPHNRTPSTGQVSPSFRALRFDPSLSVGNVGQGDIENTVSTRGLRTSSSAGSLTRGARPGVLESRLSEEGFVPDSAPADMSNFESRFEGKQETHAGDDDEDEYGRPLPRGVDGSVIVPAYLDLKPPRITLLMRDRGLSLTCSSDSSLSPILSADPQGPTTDFPFSINVPPLAYPDGTETANSNQVLLQVPPPPDGSRGRGYSVSSVSTSDSRDNPLLSTSGTTTGSGGSDAVNTPWFSSPARDSFLQVSDNSPRRVAENLVVQDGKNQISPRLKVNDLSGTTPPLPKRRYPIPAEINIGSVSSHAQAEAFVQKAQQEILDMGPAELSSGIAGAGRSPLSARLAAYGESLALERKFREQREAEQGRELSGELGSPTTLQPATLKPKDVVRRGGVERQHSLEHKTRPRLKARMPTRPSTTEGGKRFFTPYFLPILKLGPVSPRLGNQSFSGEHSGRYYQPSRSASAVPPSRLSVDRNNPLLDDHDETLTNHVLSTSSSMLRDRLGVDLPEERLMGLSSSGTLDPDAELGSPIYGATTASLGPARGSRTTAVKLTKMGFPSTEQARGSPQTPKRFGAIRSLVQTLKGKP